MKMNLTKISMAMLALCMSTSPAYAGKITSPAYLTFVSATVNMDVQTPATTGFVPCQINMIGEVKSGSSDYIEFTTSSSTCGAEIPDMVATSWTQVNATIDIAAPFGICTEPNIPFLWSSSTASRPSTFSVGWLCEVQNFTMTISPTVTII